MAIGTVAVNLVARTSVFDRKMRNSRKKVMTFSSVMKTGGKMIAAFGAATAIAATAGLYVMTKRAMESIDAIAKLSDRIGVSTESIVSLGHAAKKAGADQSTLVKSLEIMVRRLGEVKMGVGQAKYGLDALGLSADELIAKSPDEAFELISNRIMELPTAADRAVAAYYLMGRKGTELLNLMEDLSKRGLSGVREEAEKLGLTFSRIDAAKVEAANNALQDIKATLTGIGQELAIFVAPYIEAAAIAFTNWANEGESAGKKVSGMLDRVAKKFLFWEDAKWFMSSWGKAFVGMDYEKVRPSQRAVDYVKDAANELSDAAEKVQEKLAKQRAETEKAKISAKLFVDAYEPLDKVTENLKEQVALFGKTESQAAIWKLQQASIGLTADQLESYNVKLKETSELYAQLEQLQKEQQDKLEAEMQFEGLKDAFEGLKDSLLTPVEQATKEAQKAIDLLDKVLNESGIELSLEEYMKLYNKVIDRFNEQTKEKETKKPSMPDIGQGMEIQTRFMSVSGMAMGGTNPVVAELQKQTKQENENANKIVEAVKERSIA